MKDKYKLHDHDQCPSDDFKYGTPDGVCWGDGHYMCEYCVNYHKIRHLKEKREEKMKK